MANPLLGLIVLFAVVLAMAVIAIVEPKIAQADSSKGNNGQCRQLQKTFPPEIQDFQGCHDSFTGPPDERGGPLP